MIERTILKEKMTLERFKAFLAKHPDWEYVVSEYPAVWHIKLDRGGETLDDELQEHEAYPDPRLSYLVEIVQIDAKIQPLSSLRALRIIYNVEMIKVRRGKHERSVNDDLNIAATKKVGDKAVLIFLEGDRSKPIITG